MNLLLATVGVVLVACGGNGIQAGEEPIAVGAGARVLQPEAAVPAVLRVELVGKRVMVRRAVAAIQVAVVGPGLRRGAEVAALGAVALAEAAARVELEAVLGRVEMAMLAAK